MSERMSSRSETDAIEDLVRQYLREIGAYPLLTAAEEVQLATVMEDGRAAADILGSDAARSLSPSRRRQLKEAVRLGEEAKGRFIQSNLRLVVSIAKRYRSAGIPLLDLVQEGNLGLIRAVEKFDPSRGCKFSTYATWWIRQAVGRAIADKGRIIRLPAHVVELAGKVRRSATRLNEALGREPTAEEVAADAGLTVQVVLDVGQLVPEPTSLQMPVGNDGTELAELLEDERATAPFEAAAASLQRDGLLTAVSTLPEREQTVLQQRFGLDGTEPRTLEEIGRDFRLTRERIRQIEAKALARLRHPATPSNLRQLQALAQARRVKARRSPQAVS